MDATPIGRPASSVSAVPIDDGLSLFDAATGNAIALNRTASDIYSLADGTITVTDMVLALSRAYAVDPESIDAEVREAVRRLTEAGILLPAND